MKKNLLLIQLILVVIFFIVCTKDYSSGLAGGGSVEVPNGVTAMIKHSDGASASGMLVRLRRSDYVSKVTGLAKKVIFGGEVLTDSNGRFDISGVDPGVYRIEIIDAVSRTATLFSCSLGISGTVDLGTGILKPFSKITGNIDTAGNAGQRMFVQVEGLERLVQIDESGNFNIDNLPDGDFKIRVTTGSDSLLAVSKINIGAGDSTGIILVKGWFYSRRIYLNTTQFGAGVNENVTSFPLLIRLDHSNFDFTQTQDSGQDLRFTNPVGTPLPYEIETWDSTTNRAILWVLIDTVYGNCSSQYIQMYWGNESAPAASSGPAVFDTANGFTGVWHLGEYSTGLRKNSATTGRYDGIPLGFDGNEKTNGVAGFADSLDNTNDYIELGDIDLVRNLTLSAWIKPVSFSGWDWIISKPNDTLNPAPNYCVYSLKAGDLSDDGLTPEVIRLIVTYQDGYQCGADCIMAPIRVDEWRFMAGVYDGVNVIGFCDGKVVGTSGCNNIDLKQNDLSTFIGYSGLGLTQKFHGVLDEVRIENRARSGAWINLTYENMRQGSKLINY